jgi:hypothetical protein
MRKILSILSLAGLVAVMSFSVTSCRNSDTKNNEQVKEKTLDENMRTDSVRQDHTAVSDSTEHNGGMNAGGK